jgi:hypothetical protein
VIALLSLSSAGYALNFMWGVALGWPGRWRQWEVRQGQSSWKREKGRRSSPCNPCVRRGFFRVNGHNSGCEHARKKMSMRVCVCLSQKVAFPDSHGI